MDGGGRTGSGTEVESNAGAIAESSQSSLKIIFARRVIEGRYADRGLHGGLFLFLCEQIFN